MNSIEITDFLCQSGPGSWPSQVYAQSAIHPMGNSAAQVFTVLYCFMDDSKFLGCLIFFVLILNILLSLTFLT